MSNRTIYRTTLPVYDTTTRAPGRESVEIEFGPDEVPGDVLLEVIEQFQDDLDADGGRRLVNIFFDPRAPLERCIALSCGDGATRRHLHLDVPLAMQGVSASEELRVERGAARLG